MSEKNNVNSEILHKRIKELLERKRQMQVSEQMQVQADTQVSEPVVDPAKLIDDERMALFRERIRKFRERMVANTKADSNNQ